MKRFYTRERYLRLVDALTDARPDLALTTDIIVGFPGETDEDFADTLSLLEAVGFHGAFSFKYSPRPGTPALRLLARDEEVAADVAQKRLLAYQARQREIGIAQNKKLLGTTQRVLVEGPSRHDPSVLCGRTGTFKTVNFPAEGVSVGDLVDVTIIGAFTNSLRGDHVAAPA
jgi:tRNA-2-methylthio-N6-dimethylallyladenosine synthase